MLSKHERETLCQLINSDAADWMERNFYIPDPRDPVTGEILPAGPIQLAEHQKRIIRAATSMVDGQLQFVTILYSAVKKSGKTRIGAGIAAWYADTFGPFNEVYCIANDGKQSADRILSAIAQAVKIAKAMSVNDEEPGVMANWYLTKSKIILPNDTFIEAIPCDPSGQAGANPGLTVWSEMWGYRHEHKERLFSEMTVPPTRWGAAMRWIESYAGYSGESNTLESLYGLGVDNGKQHPLFPELPVTVNIPARMLCYWDHEPRMPWQTSEYYAQEASVLTPDEFRRIHKNEWVTPTEKAIPIEWWDACEDVARDGMELPRLDQRTPVILALDASVSHDSCAAVVCSRHPSNKKETAERMTRVWEPPLGGKIDLTETMEPFVLEFCNTHNVVEVAYDEYQLHKMCSDLRRRTGKRFRPFNQGAERAVADKQLYEMILQQQIAHTGHPALRKHVDNAAVKKDGKSMRFVKATQARTQGITNKPIDAFVALSMGNKECLRLNLG